MGYIKEIWFVCNIKTSLSTQEYGAVQIYDISQKSRTAAPYLLISKSNKSAERPHPPINHFCPFKTISYVLL